MTAFPSTIGESLDRLPPHSIEAEQCLIASLMLDKDLINACVQIVQQEAFYLVDHAIIFDVLIKLWERNQPVDAILVRAELEKRQQLEDVGGTAYLAQLLNMVPSAAHGVHYAGIVREKAILRRLIAASNDILRKSYSPHEKAEHVLEEAEKKIFDIAMNQVGEITTLGEVAMQVYDMLEQKNTRGIETGFIDLDELTNGLQKEEMIVVAARPSMGKTAFAMNIVEHAAANDKKPIAVFSLEMSKQQLAQRMMCSRARIDGQKVRKGMISSNEYQQLAATVVELSKAPIWVDDSPGLTIMDLRAKGRRLKMQHDIQMVVIDYMQLMDNPGPESRQQQISEISRGIKAVARDLKVPVVALSQLNRASEGRDGHRPRMSDLRESGSIEQDADVIMLLHREDYYKRGEADFIPDNIAEIIIAKQRNGPTDTVKLTFETNTTSFKNLSAPIDAF